MAEAIDHVRELGDDRRIHGGVEAIGHQEDVDVGLDLAGELLEHEVLILHLGAELGGLEQAFAVPHQRIVSPPDLAGRCSDVVDEPFIDEGKVVARQHGVLGVLDQPIVLGMEHVVDRGQADVLVDATVTGDEMGVEQLVVVFSIAVAWIGQTDGDVTVGDLADRHGLVGNVSQEGTVRADGASRGRSDAAE